MSAAKVSGSHPRRSPPGTRYYLTEKYNTVDAATCCVLRVIPIETREGKLDQQMDHKIALATTRGKADSWLRGWLQHDVNNPRTCATRALDYTTHPVSRSYQTTDEAAGFDCLEGVLGVPTVLRSRPRLLHSLGAPLPHSIGQLPYYSVLQ